MVQSQNNLRQTEQYGLSDSLAVSQRRPPTYFLQINVFTKLLAIARTGNIYFCLSATASCIQKNWLSIILYTNSRLA